MRGAAIKTKGEERETRDERRETSETTRADDDAGGFWSVGGLRLRTVWPTAPKKITNKAN